VEALFCLLLCFILFGGIVLCIVLFIALSFFEAYKLTFHKLTFHPFRCFSRYDFALTRVSLEFSLVLN